MPKKHWQQEIKGFWKHSYLGCHATRVPFSLLSQPRDVVNSHSNTSGRKKMSLKHYCIFLYLLITLKISACVLTHRCCQSWLCGDSGGACTWQQLLQSGTQKKYFEQRKIKWTVVISSDNVTNFIQRHTGFQLVITRKKRNADRTGLDLNIINIANNTKILVFISCIFT